MKASKIEIATSIVRHLFEKGFQALFAGGYVRNMILGIKNNDDIDIATNATPSAIASLFNKVVGVGEHFGVMLVIENNIPFEVATFRADRGIADGRHPQEVTFSDAETDAQRRDFTINGLFYDPLKKNVIDYVQGRKDLEKGIIRTIGSSQLRFKEDYLRLLRAVRFAARFSFTIEHDTWKALRQNAVNITQISQERILQELNKMLMGSNSDKALSLLEESGLLSIILPEVHALKGVEQPHAFHPEGDVLNHTIKTLSYLHNPSQVMAWSALLHDIGKPATQSRADRIRFNNHSRVSSTMAKDVLLRLKSSRSLINRVYECIDNHMNFINVTRMRLSTLKKFLSRPTFKDELELHRADCLASHGNIENFEFLKKKKKEIDKINLRPEPLIKGKDLIELGFEPGPLLGKILNRTYELQLDEKIHTYEEAQDWISKNRKKLQKGLL